MKSYCLKGCTLGYKGDVLNIEQDIGGLVSSLPQRIHQFPIMIWLTLLHANNPLCADINIDFDLLSQLLEDGSVEGEVNIVEEEDLGQDAENISAVVRETNVSPIQATLGPEQGRA
eukprot:2048000-Ditylum_brightwellii.AAC.1